MVAIFTGLGSGFERGSAAQLGSSGLLGSGALGRSGEQLALNAANGNLLITQRDEFLAGIGPDASVSRTYNSLGDFSDDNGDNWRQSTNRRVHGLTGTLNTAGSTIKRVSADGSDITYTCNSNSLYVATDGSGSYDTLSSASNVWTWTDGSTRSTEKYQAYGTDNWRITAEANTRGNQLSYTYTGANLTQIATVGGETIQYSWSGTNITQIVTGYTDLVANTAKTLTRTRYGYDSSNRLTSVTVDLSPEDNSVTDGATYVASYSYDGTSKRVASITETDGSQTAITYDTSGRVTSLTQTVSSGVTRVTTIAYYSGYTTVTDPQGQVTRLDYNADGSLATVTLPAATSGAAAQTLRYTYDSSGNVLTATDGLGNVTTYTYDASGNILTVTDPLGNVDTRTYDSKNQLLIDTITDVSGGTSVTRTTRYTYDLTYNRLEYTISAEGRVTRQAYDNFNNITSLQTYIGGHYDVSSLSTTASLTSKQVLDWVTGLTDKTLFQNVARFYDARGNLQYEKSYTNDLSTGAQNTAAGYKQVTYAYDQAGQLLSRVTSGFNTETFVYDGLGRIKASTDVNGATTNFAFTDSSTTTVITHANGLVETNTYNKAGELVTAADSLSGTASDQYQYDPRGNLRVATDKTGRISYFVYDKAGRKVADVDQYGNVIEYTYDADNRIIATVRYGTQLTSTQLTTVADPSATFDMSSVRPGSTSSDVRSWKVYDADNRVIEAIDGAGDVTVYGYNASGQLVSTTAYANKLTSTQLSTITLTPPTTTVLPAADAAHDSVSRLFYDKEGLLIGKLDGEGYLSKIDYDDGGQKIAETLFATQNTNTSMRATGTFSALVTAAGSTTSDRITRYVYDDQGHFRYMVDALQHVTGLTYSGTGGNSDIDDVRTIVRYATPISAPSAYTVAGIQAALTTSSSDRTNYLVYDSAERVGYTIDASGGVTGYSYDGLGQLIKTTAFSTVRTTSYLPTLATMTSWQTANSASDDRITRNYYDQRGRVKYSVDAENYLTRYDYDAEDRVVGTTRWNNTVSVSDATPTEPTAGGTTTTSTIYDNDGRVSSTTDGTSVVTSYVYNANGTLARKYDAYGSSDESRTDYFYDGAGRVSTLRVATGTAEQADTGYGYDGLGNVVSITDPTSATTGFTYDRVGQKLTEADALGGVAAYQYDAFGDAVKVTDERGSATYNYYDALGRVTTSRDANNFVTQNAYTVFGELQSVTRRYNKATDTASTTTLPTYTADSVRDIVTSYEYDRVGRLTKAIDALTNYEQYTLNAFGDRTTVRDQLGFQTTNSYDRRGLLTQSVVDSATGGQAITTAHGYDAFGREKSLTDATSHTMTKTYDGDGRLSTVTDALNHTTAYSYDKRGNLAAVTDVLGNTTRYAYDKQNRLIYTVDALGGVVQNSYDADGRVILTQAYATPISPSGLATVTTVSAIAALVTTSGSDELTRSVYDADGRLRYSFDAANILTEYDYDAAGNAIRSVTYSAAVTPSAYTIGSVQSQIAGLSSAVISASPITRNIYNAANQRIWTIDALGYVTAYSYDALGNVVKQQRVAAPYTATDDPTDAAMATWLTTNGNATNDRISRAIYDNDGQLRFDIDAETYVTQYTYNADGSVLSKVRYAARFSSVSDSTALADAVTWGGASPPSDAALTQFIYDTAGRLTETVDALGTHTVFTLDQLGRATTTTYANGSTSDVSVTTTSYDAVGRVSSVTRAYGTTEATTTSYGYDALGNLLTVQDGRNNTTTRTYDALGNVLSVSVPLSGSAVAVTFNTYDAFGNLVQVIDPLTRVGYFYYDALNRLVLQVDPAGYATATVYTFDGKVAFVNRYAAKPTGTPTIGTRPTIVTTPGQDSLSAFGYDKLDHLISSRQAVDSNAADDIVEAYSYNAFGDRTAVTNKLGGATTNSFDKLGELTSEQIQLSTTPTYVTNSYTYDARGNRKTMVEASGAAEQRTTTYTYDLADRLIRTDHDSVTVTASDLSSTTTGTAVYETLSYDLRGNVIKSVDANGAATWDYYDHLDRKIAEVSPLGMLSAWTYDANGNVQSATVYGDLLATLPTTGGGTAPTPVNATNCRITTYTYDKNNRLLTTAGAAAKMGSFDSGSYVITTDAAVSAITYDNNGNIVAQTDGRGGTVFSYYNQIGQKVAQVDQENYLTVWVRDANGNVTGETRYATRIPTSNTFDATTSVSVLQGWAGTDSTNDRTTTFTYDAAGRRLTETRLNVVTLTSTSGAPTTSSQSPTVTYTYNALGEVLTKAEASDVSGSETTTYTYDKIGRTLTEVDPTYTNQNALTVKRRTTYVYDGLNNVLSTTVDDANGNSGGVSRVTSYTYGAGGRLATMTDATGVVHSYGYDAAGHTISDSYTRTPASGSAFVEASNYRYDATGRLVYQTVAHHATGTSTWTLDADTNQIQYNAYGDVAAKGMNGQWQESYEYDANGHVWRSNAGDGSYRIYLYDKNGNATLTIASSGTLNQNASGYTLDSALNHVTNNNASTAGSIAISDAVVTIEQFDKRNQDVATREQFRELNPNASTPSVNDMANEVHQRGYNAFGEVAWEWSARYNATNDSAGVEKTLYTYNTMGRVISKQSPTVSVTAENGGISSVRPTENDYYDISGRLVAVSDGNAHVTRRTLLGGSGHGNAAALVTAETHADGAVAQTAYDVFGDAVKLTDELGNAETRTYDKLDHVLTVAHRGGLLTDSYAYDELGHQTQHWNNQFNPSTVTIKDLTSYDGQGRIVSQVISSGSADAATTSYSYTWVANSGAGYWTKATTNTAGLTASENDDYFGHVLSRVDYGAHSFSYTYDYAQRLTAQSSSTTGLGIAYTYYNSGKLAKIVTTTTTGTYFSETATSKYAYDVDGNRVKESHAVSGTGYNFSGYGGVYSYSYNNSYEDTTVVWDAMNRMTSYTDTGASGSVPATINYEYDAVGNVRHMAASYRMLDDQGNVATSATTQDYWYRYDAMDRFTTTMGTFTGTRGTTGAITRGTTGNDITYDAAGRRATATHISTLYWNGWKVTPKGQPGNYYYSDEQPDDSGGAYIVINVSVAYQGVRRETYSYRADGQLMSTAVETQGASASGSAIVPNTSSGVPVLSSPLTIAAYTRDQLGRETAYIEYNAGGTAQYTTSSSYDYLNELTNLTSTTVRGIDSYYSVTTNNYRAETYAGSGSWTGTYQGGSVVHSTTTTTKNGTSQPTSDTKNTLTWWDGAVTNVVTYKPDTGSSTTNTSTYYYDAAGHLQSVYIQDGRSRTVSFVNNAEGQILQRRESDSLSSGDPRELHYYFNNQRIGDISNNGTSNVDYVTENALHVSTSGTGPFANGAATGTPYADFDQSYDPINGLNYTKTSSRYTVNAGDTLASIATQLWGDQSLWYLLADANGLTGSETLPAGTSLIVPNDVQNVHNSGSTFRPYDPSVAQGDLSPTAPKMPKNNNCGILGAILMVIIAVAVVAILHAPVTHFLTGLFAGHAGSIAAITAYGATVAGGSTAAVAGAIVGGAIAGAAGSIVSQGIGVLTGIQDKFSWKGVALAAIGGGISGGLSKIGFLNGASGIVGHLQDAARGVLGNVASQGISIATGLQKKFDWAGVAVGGAVGATVGAIHIGGIEGRLVSGLAGGIVGGATRSLIDGSDFGDNVLAALPDIIGSTIGEFIGGTIIGDPKDKTFEGVDDTKKARYYADRGKSPGSQDVQLDYVPDIVVVANGFFHKLASAWHWAEDKFSYAISSFENNRFVQSFTKPSYSPPDSSYIVPTIKGGGRVFQYQEMSILGPGHSNLMQYRNYTDGHQDFGSLDAMRRGGHASFMSELTPEAANAQANATALSELRKVVYANHNDGLGATQGELAYVNAANRGANYNQALQAYQMGSGTDAALGVAGSGAAASAAHDFLSVNNVSVGTNGRVISTGPMNAAEGVTGGSTYASRLAQTPVSNGAWSGLRGESTFVSTHPDVVPFTGSDGIAYANAYPDFFPVSAGQVEISNMTASRSLNFAQADKAYADLSGLSVRDIKTWRQTNGYTWHETEDLRTMQLVPSPVNGKYSHVGGVGEINAGAIRH